jgi:hypothetical protein
VRTLLHRYWSMVRCELRYDRHPCDKAGGAEHVSIGPSFRRRKAQI